MTDKPNEQGSQATGCTFFIGQKPLTVWDLNPVESCKKFLSDFNSHYFLDLALLYDAQGIPTKNPSLSIAIRQLYYQACECTFAMACAVLQAPNYPQGWLLCYTAGQPYETVKSIHSHEKIPILLDAHPKHPGWLGFVDLILSPLISGSDNNETISKNANTFHEIACDYLNNQVRKDNNSIKHGFRTNTHHFTSSAQFKPVAGLTIESGSELVASHYPTDRRVHGLKDQRVLEYNSISWSESRTIARTVFMSRWLEVMRKFLLKIRCDTDTTTVSLPSAELIEAACANYTKIDFSYSENIENLLPSSLPTQPGWPLESQMWP